MKRSGTGRMMGGCEWCCDKEGVVVAVLMMKYGPEGRLCGDGNKPYDVGWCCGSHPVWGAQLGASPTRGIDTDQPGENVTTGNHSSGTSTEDEGYKKLPPGKDHSERFSIEPRIGDKTLTFVFFIFTNGSPRC